MNDGLKILFVLTMISIGISRVSFKIAKSNKLLKKAGEKEEVKVLLDRAGAKVGVIAGSRIFKCPFCAEWVKIEAKICKECGTNIEKEIAIFLTEEKRSNDLVELEMVKRSEALQLEHEKNLAGKKAKNIKVISYLRKYRIIISLLILIPIIILIGTGIKSNNEKNAASNYIANLQIQVESIYMSKENITGANCFGGEGSQSQDVAIVFKLPDIKVTDFHSMKEIREQIENFTLSSADNSYGVHPVDMFARGTYIRPDGTESIYSKTKKNYWGHTDSQTGNSYLLFRFMNPGKRCANTLNISGTNIKEQKIRVEFLEESIFETESFWNHLKLKKVTS